MTLCGGGMQSNLSSQTLSRNVLSLNSIDQSDVESLTLPEDGENRDRSFTFWRRYFGASCSRATGAKMFNYLTMLLSYGIVVVLVYLSFTMRD